MKLTQVIDFKLLGRQISIVENQRDTHKRILAALNFNNTPPLIGITGPPGSGKSSLVNALIKELLKLEKKIAILAVDPSSPFNYGALLGDRVRMNEHFNHPDVFIRSIASRGSLGGLSAKIIEITDVVKAQPFDYVFIETVGVGQSEVEIAGLADTTIVVLNPESGDDIQIIKAGILEIADIFVINKADLPGTATLQSFLIKLVNNFNTNERPGIILTTAKNEHTGIATLTQSINEHYNVNIRNVNKKAALLTKKTLKLIENRATKTIDEQKLQQYICMKMKTGSFNLYNFLDGFDL